LNVCLNLELLFKKVAVLFKVSVSLSINIVGVFIAMVNGFGESNVDIWGFILE